VKTPTLDELGRAPQLAVLVALDAARLGAFLTLINAHEELREMEPVMESNPRAEAAHRLALRLMELGRLLDAYVDALDEPLEDPLDGGPLDGPIDDRYF